MKYRKLGNTGIIVSEIGYGTWGLGGDSYGPADDIVSKNALLYAYKQGITFFDTSDTYGDGHSEELIGKTLKHVRNKIIIATKVGCLPHTGREMPQDFSTDHIKKCIKGSLKRLQTNYIDLYQLHSPPIEALKNNELLNTLKKLKKNGLIRAIGISARSPNDALIAIQKYDFDCVQVNFNLIDLRAYKNGFLNLAEKKNIGVIARTPFCFGFLTGKISDKTSFSTNDHRSNWSNEQIKRWSNAPYLFESLYIQKKISPSQLALKFCLTFKNISTVIPGMMNSKEVKENIKSSDIDNLSDNELSFIEKIYKTHNFFDVSLKK